MLAQIGNRLLTLALFFFAGGQEELAALVAKHADLGAQNELLHTHLGDLSAQLRRWQQQQPQPAEGGAGADESLAAAAAAPAGTKSIEQLWEIVRYERQKTQVGPFIFLYGNGRVPPC